MSAPTKFNMGSMPRTSTGLVPTSYRRQLETMSTASRWSPLPPKPKPAMYPYRGDYVNERNRKSLGIKNTKRRQKCNLSSSEGSRSNDRSSVSTFEQSNSSLSTYSSTPSKSPSSLRSRGSSKSSNSTSRQPASAESQQLHSDSDSESQSPTWDPYCKHNSCHQLSTEEEHARKENRNIFSSYLRSEATKRRAREEMEQKLRAELQKEKRSDEGFEGVEGPKEPLKTDAPKRKPPVPRLSGRNREAKGKNKAGGTTDYKSPKGQSSPAPTRSKNKASTKSKKTVEDSTKSTEKGAKDLAPPRVRYLDFISKQMKKDENEELNEPHSTPTSTPSPTKENVNPNKSELEDENDSDDEKFRRQIKRIVERAAEMVIKEQRQLGHADKTSNASQLDASMKTTPNEKESAPGSESSSLATKPSSSKKVATQDILQTLHKEGDARNKKQNDDDKSDLSKIRSRLTLLEERIRGVSSPGSLFSEFQKEEGTGREQGPNAGAGAILGNMEASSEEMKASVSSQRDAYFIAAGNGCNFSSDSSQISEVTEDLYLSQKSRYVYKDTNHGGNFKKLLQNIDEYSCTISGGESSTEVEPRVQIQPVQMYVPRYNHCYVESASSNISSTTGQSSSEESQSDVTSQTKFDEIYSRAKSDWKFGGMNSFDSCSSYCGKESTSEIVPRDQIQPFQPPKQSDCNDEVSNSCPIENPTPAVHPIATPSKNEEWEEEPQPRVQEKCFQPQYIGNTINLFSPSINHRESTEEKKRVTFVDGTPVRWDDSSKISSQTLNADDLFSLL